MINRILIFFIASFPACLAAQNLSYVDSLDKYLNDYKKDHEVVKGKDKEKISFFTVDEKFRVNCRFERKLDMPWFRMESSGPVKRNYRIYGKIYFSINDTSVALNIYQGQDLMFTKEYKDHLFIPFTDLTTGIDTYESGRYIDLKINDITKDHVIIDFNKAYNPYCAYISGKFNCPIPPAENRLIVAILAGEKSYQKSH